MRKNVWRIDATDANADHGRVVWAPFKSIWNTGMFCAAAALAPMYISWGSVIVFLLLGYVTLLVGHSVGMHRRLIHRSFECNKPLERFLVWIGVTVGMAGPIGILKVHDVRDWAQRQPSCHDFFAHTRGVWIDSLWQLHCRFEFDAAPRFIVEAELANDPWYRMMELTWPLHQAALAAVLFFGGGWSWVVWGVPVRVAVSVTSHWIVTYFAHNPGARRWLVRGAAVQAANLRGWAFLTHGECWHNNHHAFPESARMGLGPGQSDPGWFVVQMLAKVGLVSRIGLPRSESEREDLLDVDPDVPANDLVGAHRVQPLVPEDRDVPAGMIRRAS